MVLPSWNVLFFLCICGFVLAEGSDSRAIDQLGDDRVQAHSLPGRPLSLRAGKGVRLDRFQASQVDSTSFLAMVQQLFSGGDTRRSARRVGNGPSQVGHFVIRVARRDREAVRQGLLKLTSETNALQYLPMDTFVATFTASAAAKVSKEVKGVEGVYHLPIEMKAPPELLHRLIPSSAARTQESKWRTLDISLGYSMATVEDTAFLMGQWNSNLLAITKQSTVRAIQVGSRRKVCIDAHDSMLHKTLRFLLLQPETLWVEERMVRGFENKFATRIVAGEKLYLWEPTGDIEPATPPDDNVNTSTKGNGTESNSTSSDGDNGVGERQPNSTVSEGTAVDPMTGQQGGGGRRRGAAASSRSEEGDAPPARANQQDWNEKRIAGKAARRDLPPEDGLYSNAGGEEAAAEGYSSSDSSVHNESSSEGEWNSTDDGYLDGEGTPGEDITYSDGDGGNGGSYSEWDENRTDRNWTDDGYYSLYDSDGGYDSLQDSDWDQNTDDGYNSLSDGDRNQTDRNWTDDGYYSLYDSDWDQNQTNRSWTDQGYDSFYDGYGSEWAPEEGNWGDLNGLWRRGLTGAGEVVGMCDSGVDVDSCYFHDPQHAPPLCFDLSYRRGYKGGGSYGCRSTAGEPVGNPEHRKIVGYRVHRAKGARDGDDPSEHDDRFGNVVHGTMVAGALAGAAWSEDSAEADFAAGYNGIAPGAKLAVDDVLMEEWADGLPHDLTADLWPWSYDLGARVHLNSWADQSVLYTQVAAELDEFTYQHPDFTVVMAAGNFGPNAVTVLSPGTAKNAITVGASESDLDSYLTNPNLELKFSLDRVPSRPELVGRGYYISPAAFGGEMKLSAPVSGATTMLDRHVGCGDIPGAPDMVHGNIVLAWHQTACSHPDMVLNLEQKGAIAVLILLPSRDVEQQEGGAGDAVPSVPVAYVDSGPAEAAETLFDANNRNGSVWLHFPVAWKHGPSALAGFSSRGPTPDGRFKPDIIAPGDNIITPASDNDADSFQCPTHVHDPALAVGSGTSLAAPFVAGAVAIVRQYFREGMYDGEAREPSAALVKAMILNSGVALTWYYDFADWDLGYGRFVDDSVPTVEQGYGRVQLDRVLRFRDDIDGYDQPDLHVVDSEEVWDGGAFSLCVRADATDGGWPLKVTLVWTDPPSSPSSWGLLINDLDLEVTTPDGERVLGNQLSAYNALNKQHQVLDSINTNEQVALPAPAPGLYRIDVFGRDVPIAPQRWALAVTGRFSVEGTCPAAEACPRDCSGVGECEHGMCRCPLSRRGVACELENVELVPNRQVTDMISSGGWSYFLFDVRPSDRWQVTMESTVSYADPDMFVAVDRLPTLSDHDKAHLYGPDLLIQRFSHVDAPVRHNATVVVGVNVFCCYHASVKMSLSLWTADGGGSDGGGGGSEPPDVTPPAVDPPPRDGDPVDVVTFRMVMAESKAAFQVKETQYRQAVAAVANIELDQVSVRYVEWGEQGDRRSDRWPEPPSRRERQARGQGGRRTATGALGVVVEFVLVVLTGKGHMVAVALHGEELYEEIEERRLPSPLNVYEHRFKQVMPDDDEQPAPTPKPDLDGGWGLGGSHDPVYSTSGQGGRMKHIGVTLACCLIIAMLALSVVYFRRKRGMAAAAAVRGHSSLVYIQSGHTPGSPTAPDFIDASTAVRGLILGANGTLLLPTDPCEETTPFNDPADAGVTPHDEETPADTTTVSSSAYPSSPSARGTGAPTTPATAEPSPSPSHSASPHSLIASAHQRARPASPQRSTAAKSSSLLLPSLLRTLPHSTLDSEC